MIYEPQTMMFPTDARVRVVRHVPGLFCGDEARVQSQRGHTVTLIVADGTINAPWWCLQAAE